MQQALIYHRDYSNLVCTQKKNILTTAHSIRGGKSKTFYQCVAKLESILINAH